MTNDDLPRISDIICNWCYIPWFIPEAAFLPVLVVSISNDYDEQKSQHYTMAYNVSVKWPIKCNITNFEEFVVVYWYWKYSDH